MGVAEFESRCNIIKYSYEKFNIFPDDDGTILVVFSDGFKVFADFDSDNIMNLKRIATQIAENNSNSMQACADCPFYLNCLPTPSFKVYTDLKGQDSVYPVLMSAHSQNSRIIFPTDHEDD